MQQVGILANSITHQPSQEMARAITAIMFGPSPLDVLAKPTVLERQAICDAAGRV